MGARTEIKILLVDDHEVVRIGLTSLLQRCPNFVVAGEAGSAAEAIQKTDLLRPDVVIMDIRMPEGSGIEACREICSSHPETKVIMLTSYGDEEAVLASVMAGAKGYVLKQIGSQALIDAIQTVAKGQSLLDPGVTNKVLEHMRAMARDTQDKRDALNEQEQRILALIAEGKTNKEIAGEVFLSEKTVRNYVSSILSKLNLSNRSQAAAYASQMYHVKPKNI